MFLRHTSRWKNGKENRRVSGGKVVQRPVLYLGEINDRQEEAWCKTVEIFEEGQARARTVALFPEDRLVDIPEQEVVRLRLGELSLHRPRQWGACWFALHLWEQLGLDRFWAAQLPPNRKGTRWDIILQVLVVYRLIDPGSEWRLHRHWFEHSALGDLLGGDLQLAELHKLYSCHEQVLAHKQALFTHLASRWQDLFNASFELLLYDLTSTYFESEPPFPEEEDKRRYGYSRDKRPDCVQVVIALIVTPEGFPLAYEVLAGNTSDRTTLESFLKKIEDQYGRAQRIWVMDRGVPTEKVLAQMRAATPPIQYLVGTPKGRLKKYEQRFLEQSWQTVREGVSVKLLAEEQELYVLAESRDRVNKERAMRRSQLKRLWRRLKTLQGQKLKRDALLKKLGAALHSHPSAARLVHAEVAPGVAQLNFQLLKDKLREVRQREGRYLLRTNIGNRTPEELWKFYIQLTHVEEAFKDLKNDLSVRPIHHQLEHRIEAHILISFLAYCLHVTLHRQLREQAPGLTPRAVLEKFATIQMLDVHLPTTDGRTVVLSRYTQPGTDVQLLLQHLKLHLPAQPLPKIVLPEPPTSAPLVVKT